MTTLFFSLSFFLSKYNKILIAARNSPIFIQVHQREKTKASWRPTCQHKKHGDDGNREEVSEKPLTKGRKKWAFPDSLWIIIRGGST
jgi:hypothetical protein